jgi:hypothetical protein
MRERESMEKTITIKFRIDETDEVQEFIAKMFERAVETATLKAWKKVVNRDAEEELKLRGVGLTEPAIFFNENGVTVRVATKESNGRDTAIDTEDEGEGDVKDGEKEIE